MNRFNEFQERMLQLGHDYAKHIGVRHGSVVPVIQHLLDTLRIDIETMQQECVRRVEAERQKEQLTTSDQKTQDK